MKNRRFYQLYLRAGDTGRRGCAWKGLTGLVCALAIGLSAIVPVGAEEAQTETAATENASEEILTEEAETETPAEEARTETLETEAPAEEALTETLETELVAEETETQASETEALIEETQQEETEIQQETTEESSAETLTALETQDSYAAQAEVDAALEAELQNGYTFEDPLVVVNPYGTSPLTAVAVFVTEEELGGTVTVKGKTEDTDVTGSFEKATEHLVPIYGLYAGETTEVILTLEDGSESTLEVTTEAITAQIGEITATVYDDDAYDESQLTIVCGVGGSIYALDKAGEIRWYYSGIVMGVHQLENGHLMLPSSDLLKTTYYCQGLKEIDLCGRVYQEYAIPGGMHHDFQELPNGNLLVASDSPDFSSVEDYVVEIDRKTGEVVWELDMKDLLDLTDGESASMDTDGCEESDWFHNNGLWYDEENDLVLLSARHKDAIIAVNKTEKTLAWILGDPTGWETVDESYFFTPVGDDFEWQYAQHQVSMLDNGDIMMFDNGTAKVKRIDGEDRVSGADVYSRAVIYHIDTDAMTIEQVFEYGKERGAEWYADWISGVESLDGTQDHLWITAGSHLYSESEDRHDFYPADMFGEGLTKSTHIDQVDEGELTYEIVIEGDSYTAMTYRSFRMALYGENTSLDLSVTPQMLGSLGVTSTVEADVPLTFTAEALENASDWTIKLDEVKLSVKGSFVTDTAAESVEDGYLMLVSGDEVRCYSLTQTAAAGEDATTVTVSGWVSSDGLEGESLELYLYLDGTVYETGYLLEL